MKKYDTIINYIEPTKILQRVTVDTFNNTYPLGHNYVGQSQIAAPTIVRNANAFNGSPIPLPALQVPLSALWRRACGDEAGEAHAF